MSWYKKNKRKVLQAIAIFNLATLSVISYFVFQLEPELVSDNRQPTKNRSNTVKSTNPPSLPELTFLNELNLFSDFQPRAETKQKRTNIAAPKFFVKSMIISSDPKRSIVTIKHRNIEKRLTYGQSYDGWELIDIKPGVAKFKKGNQEFEIRLQTRIAT